MRPGTVIAVLLPGGKIAQDKAGTCQGRELREVQGRSRSLIMWGAAGSNLA